MSDERIDRAVWDRKHELGRLLQQTLGLIHYAESNVFTDPAKCRWAIKKAAEGIEAWTIQAGPLVGVSTK